MKKLGLLLAAISALALLQLLTVAPAGAQTANSAIACNSPPLSFDSAAGGTVVLFHPTDTRRQMYICGYVINTLTAGTIQLKYGTGTTCGTGTTNITPAWQLTAFGQMNVQASNWEGISVPPGNDICITTPATAVQAQVFMAYY